MIRARYCKRWLLSWTVAMLAACGGGGGGGEEGQGSHAVRAEAYCEAGSGAIVDYQECSAGKVSPQQVIVENGNATSFRVSDEPLLITQVESSCKINTPLKNPRVYSSQEFGGMQSVSGELSGDSLTTAAVTYGCNIRIYFLRELEISTDAGLHGSIEPQRKIVSSRTTTEFKLNPDDGYVVGGVEGCGTGGSLEGNTFTISNVTSDCLLSVHYLEIPDMAGIWSGTWEGVDAAFGPVAGTWVTRMLQNQTRLSGPIEFSGDLDCAEGNMSGIADPRESTISGEIERHPSPEPCPTSSWIFSAFDDKATSASGRWSKSGLSSGAFEGRRIATLDGPNIRSFYPPWAGAGAYVTIVGERLDMSLINDSLSLGFGGTMLVPEAAGESMILLKLPGAIGDSEQFYLSTPKGAALSPLPLNTGVTGPDSGYIQWISLADTNPQPASVVFSINNRRAFVANRGTGSVSMINTDLSQEFTSTPIAARWLQQVAVHAIAADPDGRRIYVAGDGIVGVLHSHTMELLDTLELPAYGSAQTNPQGVAVSPDGRWLLLSEATPGGRISIVDTDNGYRIADTLMMPTGSAPRGVAVSPDNRHAYIALSGSVNQVRVYDLLAGIELSPIDIGESPIAIAVTPDASRIFVTNGPADTVHSYDFNSGLTQVFDLGPAVYPNALAITPDGARVLVANDSNSIYVIDIASSVVISVAVGDASSGIAISRDGRRAYATLPRSNRLVEIGNQRTLRISKQGGGLGTVRTQPDAINCGTECSATFAVGTQVVLRPGIPTGFRFDGWGGDSDCQDGRVSMTANRYCVASFSKIPAPSPPPYSGGGGVDVGPQHCFIATAAYGSWLDPHVVSLRLFRDQHLLTNAAGTRVVELYYRHSPPLADYIRQHESLRAVVRALLAIVVYAIEYPLAAGLTIWLLLLLSARRRAIRRQARRFASA